MTLKYLLDHVTVQGGVVINSFSEDGEEETTIFSTPDIETERRNISKETLRRKVKYIYPADFGTGFIVIEIEGQEE